MSRPWRLARRGVMAGQLAVGLALTLVVPGCSGADAGTTSSPPTPTASSSAAFETRMDALMASVNAVRDSAAVVSVPARPTVVRRQQSIQTMIIRDEDAGAWQPGRYRLVVRCAGEGVLVAHFSLGERSVIRQLTECTATTSTDYLDLVLDQATKASVVVIVPAGQSMAAVGYQIEKAR